MGKPGWVITHKSKGSVYGTGDFSAKLGCEQLTNLAENTQEVSSQLMLTPNEWLVSGVSPGSSFLEDGFVDPMAKMFQFAFSVVVSKPRGKPQFGFIGFS